MQLSTDAVLWYNVGVFGEAGYAVPNASNDGTSLNDNIIDLVDIIGRNLAAILRSEDADLRTPPSINTLMRVHKLYVRLSQIIGGRSVPSGTPNFEKTHISPDPEGFRVFPCPYFRLRNQFMRRWTKWTLELLAECMQHTENRKSVEISTTFGGMVGAYAKRVYNNMAIELFGKTPIVVNAEGFLLTDADFKAYDPSKFFTSTELIDTVAPTRFIWTEDQLKIITDGILVIHLPNSVQPWPGGAIDDSYNDQTSAPSGQSSSKITVAGFPPAPQP